MKDLRKYDFDYTIKVECSKADFNKPGQNDN